VEAPRIRQWVVGGAVMLALCSPAVHRAHAKTLVAAEKPDEAISAAAAKQIQMFEDADLAANAFTTTTQSGLTFASGNTRALAISGRTNTMYRYHRFENLWRLGTYYNRVYNTTGTAATGTTAKYLYGLYRLDYYFSPRTTVYFGGGGYTDRIKGIDVAGQGFTGLSHYFLRAPRYSLRGAAGYDFTFEKRLPPDDGRNVHSATLEMLYRQLLRESVTLTGSVNVQADLQRVQNVRVQSEAELKVGLSHHLSLATRCGLRFTNDPVPGFRAVDTQTDVLLGVEF